MRKYYFTSRKYDDLPTHLCILLSLPKLMQKIRIDLQSKNWMESFTEKSEKLIFYNEQQKLKNYTGELELYGEEM